MTASSVDTAELPVIDRATVVDPSLDWDPGVLSEVLAPSPSLCLVTTPAPCPGRAALRAERQLLRRQQQHLALMGLSLMAATFGAAVAVLDLVH
jgi:hypothetical protein